MKNQKGSATVIVFIVFLLTMGGAVWYFTNISKGNLPAEQSQVNSIPTESQADKQKTYKNTLLGYEISLKSPWRVAENFTLKFQSEKNFISLAEAAGCSMFSENSLDVVPEKTYADCLAKHPELNQQSKEFNKTWSISKSEMVILTDLPNDQEAAFLQEVLNHKTNTASFPSEHAIIIYPVASGLVSKETSLNSKSKIKIQYYNLVDGTKTSKIDDRAIEPFNEGTIASIRSLSINVPHNFTYKMLSGDMEKGLYFKVLDAEQGSKLEQTFYEVVNSVKFSQ